MKGKTWGPSTLHQRERGYLPALKSTVRTPHFSKSAPNLDKSRSAVSASSSRNDILGKSHDGLNTINNSKHYQQTTSCTLNLKNYVSSNSTNSSISSRISDNKRNRSLDSSNQGTSDVPGQSDQNEVPYDRVFYRTIQKSLDDIFSERGMGESDLDEPISRISSSKSSDNLTMYASSRSDSTVVEDSDYKFHRFGSAESKFKRECFFVSQSKSGSVDDSHSTSTDQHSDLQDRFSNIELSESSNEVGSSRKSSVTFRTVVDVKSDYEHLCLQTPLRPSEIYSDYSTAMREYDSNCNASSRPNSFRNKLDRTKRKFKLSRLFGSKKEKEKMKSRKLVQHTNSIYLKRNSGNPGERERLLLTETEGNVIENESPYGRIKRTKNYLIVENTEPFDS